MGRRAESVVQFVRPQGRGRATSDVASKTSSARRDVELVSAKDWQKRLAQLERMNAKDRREFEAKRRLEMSVEDLRDEIVGHVIAELGNGVEDKAFELCHARGGPHPSTLKSWRDRQVVRPWTSKLRQAGVTVGWDLRWVKS